MAIITVAVHSMSAWTGLQTTLTTVSGMWVCTKRNS